MPTRPLWEPTLSYNEADLRSMDSMLAMTDGTVLGSRPGARPGDPGLTVTLSGTTINVGAGVATLYRSGQGVYRAYLAATSPGTLTAANATYTRIDLVYLRVWDTAVDATGLRQADAVYLPGTAAAAPVAPSPGPTEIYIPLATITVPPTGAGAPTVNGSVLPVTVAPGGILPVTSATDLAATGSYTGQARYNTVRGCPEYWNGSAWTAQGDSTSFTPTFSSLGGGASLGNGTLTSRWTRIGNQVQWSGSFTIGSTTNTGTGLWFISMPTPQASGFTRLGSLNLIAGGNNYLGAVSCNPADGGKAALIAKSPFSNVSFDNVSGTVPVAPAAGQQILWNVSYEGA
ncbi:hypothetical protein AB0O91_20985 [Kitasatospora sp. NPDC089797]|uniref:hypothetical protein n=1 Tax=Kitasatospora sp. NPDC089797 TaxID=3155298 RepID=UPI0034299205